MAFLKNIFSKIIGGLKNKPKTTENQKIKEEIKTQQLIKEQHKEELKEKSDEELIDEINSLAPGIFAQAKTPEMKKTIIEIYKKMVKDGVNVKNEKEVEKWMAKNANLFNNGDVPKIETYRREKPKVGRNDPCPCGSGKKYKKCCGTKE